MIALCSGGISLMRDRFYHRWSRVWWYHCHSLCWRWADMRTEKRGKRLSEVRIYHSYLLNHI